MCFQLSISAHGLHVVYAAVFLSVSDQLLVTYNIN